MKGSLFLVSAPVNKISIRETLICANLNLRLLLCSGVVIKILSTEGIFSVGGLDATFSPDPWSRMYFAGRGLWFIFPRNVAGWINSYDLAFE